MTGRKVDEWVGKTPDSAVPWSCEDRLLERADNKCQGCGQRVGAGNPYDVDHIVGLKEWKATTEKPHGNRESNLQILCRKGCHKSKSVKAHVERATAARKKKHLTRPTKKGTWFRGWRKTNGEIVWNPNYRRK